MVKCARAIQQCIASSVPPCGRHLPCLLCVSPGTDGAIGNEANGDSVGTGGVRSGLERACSKNSRGLRPRPMNARHKRGQHVRPRDPARSVRLAPFGTASSGDGTGVGRRGESSEGRRGAGRQLRDADSERRPRRRRVSLAAAAERGSEGERLGPVRRLPRAACPVDSRQRRRRSPRPRALAPPPAPFGVGGALGEAHRTTSLPWHPRRRRSRGLGPEVAQIT